VVEIRTVMYEIRNELNMNVSESRKIHIIALPHGTFLNARWSDDQSATTPSMPGASVPVSAAALVDGWFIALDPLSTMAVQQHAEQRHPYDQQEMPVHGAQLDAQSNLDEIGSAHGA
jgi:hypothetical protein